MLCVEVYLSLQLALPKVLVTSMILWPTYEMNTLARTLSRRYNPCDTFMKNICNSGTVLTCQRFQASSVVSLSFRHNMIHYPKFMWQIVVSEGSRVRNERMEEKDHCWSDRRHRGMLCHLSALGCAWEWEVKKKKKGKKEKKNNILPGVLLIHKATLSSQIHTSPWRSRLHFAHLHCHMEIHGTKETWTQSGGYQPTAINPHCRLESVQMRSCSRAPRCLMIWGMSQSICHVY